ncbi:transcription factor BIM1 isoform X1 [Capsicum annuum]|uniref:transcription factor BIM1 isoform X1 n=1 Tax=Capsicum annuum TaxID=4072 RepID=UPI001FB0FB02|nr:transcription factor BIM1 isoform X1 [Capsicum annuum]XP_016555927.2 transcription factor BIM1 isoform X1 [Capsicum annuum]XP_047269820.1 transcription factor BIM1 isoform X1 [Capsicum annuum]
MELPQSRTFGTEGRKTTHDFLSLYSPIEQDPRPMQGGYVKTHDFLQPLEQARKTIGKEENKVEVEAVENPPSAEHILPGGIGTYSISYLQQRVPKPEASTFAITQASSTDRDDRNSNCSSYSGSGFTLWNESTMKNGKTVKENLAGDRHVIREAGVNIGGGKPTTSLERQSQFSSNHNHNTATLSSHSSPQQPSAMDNQSFIHMITSARNAQEDNDDEEEEFVVKKESPSPSRGNLSVKVDGKNSDQKPNTPRSKHSATEQRRRSKINDRFLRLREIIPHSDQKRDKASFLLEVIEYIQFLQEKVHKYEGSYQGLENKPSTLPWNKFNSMAQGLIDHSQGTNSASSHALIHAAQFDENKIGISATGPVNGQTLEPKRTSSVKERGQLSELTNKGTTLCMQPNTFPFCANTSIASLQSTMAPDAVTLELKSQPQFSLSRSNVTNYAVTDHKLKGQEMSIESGTVSISSIYSQRLLNTLKQALQKSGVDLLQANMSVQIDLAKRANDRSNASASNFKDDNISSNNQPTSQSIHTSTRDESVHTFKRLKTN